MDKENMLILLNQQLENFYSIKTLFIVNSLLPASIFLPKTIKDISEQLTIDPGLIHDCLNFLDIVNQFSFIVYGDQDHYVTTIKNIIADNRTVNNINKTLSREVVEDFIFDSKEAIIEFLDNNKFLISIYIYSLISYIFYNNKK